MASPATYPSPQQPPSVLFNPGDYADLHVQGYPKLAYFFSQCSRYLHLRRFSALSVRALLYRQHELAVLEKKLLDLEKTTESSGLEGNKRFYHEEYLKTKPEQEHAVYEEAYQEQRNLYNTLKHELKEYEEGLIRFDKLGSKGWDPTELQHIQRALAQPELCGLTLFGAGANAWGTFSDPSGHARDIIEVIGRPKSSFIAKLLKNNFLLWTPRLSESLRPLIFWCGSSQDKFGQYSHSTGVFENVSLAIGNVATSLFVYGAITSLYFATGEVINIVTVMTIALVVTICSIIFQNQQFITMLSTVCAVLVTLLANNTSKEEGHRG